jgi:hypothetical protein
VSHSAFAFPPTSPDGEFDILVGTGRNLREEGLNTRKHVLVISTAAPHESTPKHPQARIGNAVDSAGGGCVSGYFSRDLVLFAPENIQAQVRTTSALSKFSPTHKRTEGRAPVWSSEFTTQVAHYRRDSAETAAGLKRNLCDLRGARLPPLEQLSLIWNSHLKIVARRVAVHLKASKPGSRKQDWAKKLNI